VQLKAQYDPIMQDSDQNPDFFYPQKFLSVYIVEVNGRVEYTLSSKNKKSPKQWRLQNFN